VHGQEGPHGSPPPPGSGHEEPSSCVTRDWSSVAQRTPVPDEKARATTNAKSAIEARQRRFALTPREAGRKRIAVGTLREGVFKDYRGSLGMQEGFVKDR
jgi:hypothetical protein